MELLGMIFILGFFLAMGSIGIFGMLVAIAAFGVIKLAMDENIISRKTLGYLLSGASILLILVAIF